MDAANAVAVGHASPYAMFIVHVSESHYDGRVISARLVHSHKLYGS